LKENSEPSERPMRQIPGEEPDFTDTTAFDGILRLPDPILPLRELEAPAGTGLTVLLPFHHPGIPGQKTVTPQGSVVGLVYLAKRPGKSMTARAGLTVGPSAKDID
jgi:hypothetical protein